MIIHVSFKTPDAVHYALEEEFGREEPATEELEEKRAKAEEVLKKFISYGECVSIEFDVEKGTARVCPARR